MTSIDQYGIRVWNDSASRPVRKLRLRVGHSLLLAFSLSAALWALIILLVRLALS